MLPVILDISEITGRKIHFVTYLIAELLMEEGCIVENANDGATCIDMLEKADADYYKMILMDIQMPVMNECSCCKACRYEYSCANNDEIFVKDVKKQHTAKVLMKG